MARQIIKLKRSNLAGSRPTVGTLQLGELAMNTADGNIFFERSGSGTVEQVVTTTPVTGSLNMSGSFDFKGPFLIRKSIGGDTIFEVKQQGYIVVGEFTASLSSITSPETGSLVFSGSGLHIYC